jgi:hypothetical protein
MNETRPHAPTRRSLLLRVAAALRGAAVILPPASFAQVPGRAITIIVLQTPGTGPDILARTIGPELQQRLGQPVVVDNVSGAAGAVDDLIGGHIVVWQRIKKSAPSRSRAASA